METKFIIFMDWLAWICFFGGSLLALGRLGYWLSRVKSASSRQIEATSEKLAKVIPGPIITMALSTLWLIL